MRTILGVAAFLGLSTASAGASATLVSTNPVAGFFTGDDRFSHAIVATTDGKVRELFWSGATEATLPSGTAPPFGSSVIAQFPASSIIGVAGHYTAFDGYRHAFVALTDGTVHEVFFHNGIYVDQLFSLSPSAYGSIVQISSYATPDEFQHVVVLTSKGFVMQYRFSPYCHTSCGVNYGFITYPQTNWAFPLSGYYADSQGKEHIVTAWNFAGNPYIEDEVFSQSGASTWSLLPNVVNYGTFVAVSSFYNGANYYDNFGNEYFDTIVGGMHDPVGGDFIEEYASWPENGTGHTTDCVGGGVPSGIAGISGFADPVSNPTIYVKHVVVAGKDGSVTDYWRDNVKANGNYVFRQAPFGRF